MNSKQLLFFCLWALLPLALWAQSPDASGRHPKREFRGAWIQTVNGQFKGMTTEKVQQTLVNQLNALHQAGINAILFQVRPEADALYASRLEPWSRYLTGYKDRRPIRIGIRCNS